MLTPLDQRKNQSDFRISKTTRELEFLLMETCNFFFFNTDERSRSIKVDCLPNVGGKATAAQKGHFFVSLFFVFSF